MRGTTASFYDGLGTIEAPDPAEAVVAADESPHCRRSLLWLEALARKADDTSSGQYAQLPGYLRKTGVGPASPDQAAGVRRSGGGLARRGDVPSQPGPEWPDGGFTADYPGSEVLGALLALTDWLAPHPRRPARVAVPDVRGLFYSVCCGITGKLGLRVTVVRLTEHPMPVDGLVVGQSPRSPGKTRRGSALTVHVWHPPVRSARPALPGAMRAALRSPAVTAGP